MLTTERSCVLLFLQASICLCNGLSSLGTLLSGCENEGPQSFLHFIVSRPTQCFRASIATHRFGSFSFTLKGFFSSICFLLQSNDARHTKANSPHLSRARWKQKGKRFHAKPIVAQAEVCPSSVCVCVCCVCSFAKYAFSTCAKVTPEKNEIQNAITLHIPCAGNCRLQWNSSAMFFTLLVCRQGLPSFTEITSDSSPGKITFPKTRQSRWQVSPVTNRMCCSQTSPFVPVNMSLLSVNILNKGSKGYEFRSKTTNDHLPSPNVSQVDIAFQICNAELTS